MKTASPVFVYEWITSSRRWHGYALRAAFVLVLLTSLVVIWYFSSRPLVMRSAASPIRMMAQFGERFFIAMIGTQLTLVLLAAPAATAGAICIDRARGTLTHLLVTDLTDAEIVLGKLAARLVPVLWLVACALPMMELLTLLGGVDPFALLAAFIVTIGIAVLGCSLALVFSLLAGKTHEALLGTYAVWGLWLLSRPMLAELSRIAGLTIPPLPGSIDPFWLAFAPYWSPGSVTWSEYAWFLGGILALSIALVSLAVLRMRKICTREVVRSARPRFAGLRFLNLIDVTRYLPGPSLDSNPVLWREWHRTRPSRWARIVITLYVTLAAVFSFIAVVSSANSALAAFVNGFQVSIGLLLLSVTAATSLAEERSCGSLDVLLSTPISTRQVVFGKWLGTYRLVPLLAILPALLCVGIIAAGNPGWSRLVLTVAYVLSSGAAITSLGLAMATWVKRLGRAVGLTVVSYVVISVGLLFLAMELGGNGPNSAMMGSPFFGAGELAFELRQPSRGFDCAAGAILWTLLYACAAALLMFATIATFDRSLGRIDNEHPARTRRRNAAIRRARKPVVMPDWSVN
jgi:ABC-type transport system involved in multi-copper enzyme maturation permease subunit